MIIYEFNTMGAKPGELYSVTPHKLAEKPKSYMGGGMRINKDDIDVLSTSLGCRMYRLDDDPSPFIIAMMKHYEKRVEGYSIRLKQAKATLNKWRTLWEGSGNEEQCTAL